MYDYVLISLIVTGAITLILGVIMTGTNSSFDIIVNIGAGFLVLHAAHTMISNLLLEEHNSINIAAPYSLIFGPLYFFAYQFGAGKKVSKMKIVLHSLPFLLAFTFDLFLLAFPGFGEQFREVFLDNLYILIPISFFSYAVWGFLYKGLQKVRNFRSEQKLLHFISVILIITSTFFVTVRFTNSPGKPAYDYPALVVYFIMLFASYILLIYNINKFRLFLKLRHSKQTGSNTVIQHEDASSTTTSYKKSAITKEIMDEYEEKFYYWIKTKHVFLDPDLTLSKMATLMSIPRHHLTQLVNLRLGKNFNQIINYYRIEFACNLLKDKNTNSSIEEIGLTSGFSSRISFNRNFKNGTGTTPSEYKRINGQMDMDAEVT